MQVNRVSVRQGLQWIGEGLRLVRRSLGPLSMLTLAYLFALMLLTLIPVIGPAAPLILVQVLSMGLMEAVRMADRGESPPLSTLFAGFRRYGTTIRNRLIGLGLINAAATLVALAAAASVDDGSLIRIATGSMDPSELQSLDSTLLWASLIFAALYMPAQMALWFAPMFAAWHGLGIAQSLFYSFFTVWRNRGAFTAFMLGWFAMAFIASLVLQAIKWLAPNTPVLLSIVLTPLSLILMTALYASYWPSYRDSVGTSEA
ncbi:MAG: hypothetical protein EB036_08510 [Betaproteobacteria bacterium]|nr:hypothetical protein [Betaproteobacteria bacterium]NCW81746.1 hypothetical protein [Betaproteobacteria bacterium]NCY05860.1 hypothetical protein [Betaproteobacteria bacterium]NDA92348.1 hypothetical protein [Betaproteobacteria bacterium]NDC01607.1 hypothetical protein [Betaproteobacteria bacterium]